jgi:ABC-type transport system substrate-binding protein
MAKIGIKVKANANTFPELQSKIKKKKAQIFGIAWGADYPDPQNFFQLYYSKNAAEGGPNDTNFNNAEFDKAYEAALKLPDGPERTALYQKMRDIVVEEAPWIYNGHRTEAIVNHKWLKNFKYSDVIPDTAKYLRIDPKERAEAKAKL